MTDQSSEQQPFGEVERVIFRTYVNCQITIAHPRELYQELDLTQEQLAIIAGCSLATMERWLSQNHEPRMLKEVYLRRLGEFRFLLRHYPQIPPDVWRRFCPLSPRELAKRAPEAPRHSLPRIIAIAVWFFPSFEGNLREGLDSLVRSLLW